MVARERARWHGKRPPAGASRGAWNCSRLLRPHAVRARKLVPPARRSHMLVGPRRGLAGLWRPRPDDPSGSVRHPPAPTPSAQPYFARRDRRRDQGQERDVRGARGQRPVRLAARPLRPRLGAHLRLRGGAGSDRHRRRVLPPVSARRPPRARDDARHRRPSSPRPPSSRTNFRTPERRRRSDSRSVAPAPVAWHRAVVGAARQGVRAASDLFSGFTRQVKTRVGLSKQT